MTDFAETPEATVRRFARQLELIRELHQERRYDGDGFTVRRCRECGWNWPCPTTRALYADVEDA